MDQPPAPPITPPPIPPRRPPSNHGVLIALLVLALIVICAAAALIYGVRIISRNVSVSHNGDRQVSIKTPVGNLGISKGVDVDPALIGLPVYPGAQRMHDDSANLQMDFPGGNDHNVAVGVMAAKFQTPDPLDQVASYYRDQLGNVITKTTRENGGEKITFEIKRPDREKVVSLKTTSSGTEIALVSVRHGNEEAN